MTPWEESAMKDMLQKRKPCRALEPRNSRISVPVTYVFQVQQLSHCPQRGETSHSNWNVPDYLLNSPIAMANAPRESGKTHPRLSGHITLVQRPSGC